MTKEEKIEEIHQIHRRAIDALVDDAGTDIDIFVLRVDALDELKKGANAMIEMMYWFDNDQKKDYF